MSGTGANTGQVRPKIAEVNETSRVFRRIGANTLADSLSGMDYERSGDDILSSGLYVDLGPWGYHFPRCSRMKMPETTVAKAVGNSGSD
jgi:hypothetical protein